MAKTILMVAFLCMGVSTALGAAASQPGASKDHPNKAKDEITVRGCVAKLNTDYILTQPDQGNSYQLQGSRKLRLRTYLGQQVEVTGTESPSMSTSSDFLARTGSASPVTINITSIKTIDKRCSAY